MRNSFYWRSAVLILAGWWTALAQVPAEWHRIGNAALHSAAAGLATGPVERVWYGPEGTSLYARGTAGLTFVTKDFDRWEPANAAPPVVSAPALPRLPRGNVRAWPHPMRGSVWYSAGQQVARSEDGGQNWADLTSYHRQSILGGDAIDLAFSPTNPEDIAVAGKAGVWRSLDGGLTWTSLNAALPNLPAERLVAVPAAGSGARVGWSEDRVAEWQPGEKFGWTPTDSVADDRQQGLTAQLGIAPTAFAAQGDFWYAGFSDGRLWVSRDGGQTGQFWPATDSGPVAAISVDPRDPAFALAALGTRSGETRHPHLLRTLNGGALWDDLTANLPEGAYTGVAFDRASGAVYVAGERGLLLAYTDLYALGTIAAWQPLGRGLPSAPVLDVKLDAAGNNLYALVAGYGLYATIAPHRARQWQVVSTADYQPRAAAPGALLSILGARIQSGTIGAVPVPVLSATEEESQIQVPYTVRGSSVPLTVESNTGRSVLQLPLQAAAPVIFVDKAGTALLLDAETGTLLDDQNPLSPESRLQILCTGLGRVEPNWPTGVAAPLTSPPAVAARVEASLNGQALAVTRATLAPGYIGYYLVEVTLPRWANRGPAELWLTVDGRTSNRVRVYLAE